MKNTFDEQFINDLSVGLKDIIIGKQGIFYEYADKKVIGKKIKDALLSKYNDGAKGRIRKKGFSFSDDNTSIGIISQCQGLQTLAQLIDNLQVDLDDKNKEVILTVFDDILESVIKDDGLVFDSSPYDAKFDKSMPYVESITWVVSALLSCLRLHISQKNIFDIGADRFTKAIYVIKEALRILCDAYIPCSEIAGEKAINKGWNFTNFCEEPSLYFCFSVSECYVDIYNTFKDYIVGFENKRRAENNIIVEENKKTMEEREDYLNSDEGKRLISLFYEINKGEPLLPGTVYCKLETYCREVANRVWDLVKGKFAQEFFNNDLATTVSEDIINQSSTNDALFNTMFIINILINGAYDEILNDEILKVSSDKTLSIAEKEQRINFAQAEYDNLLETIQLAYQRAYRCYNQLENEDKEHIVEQYTLGFNEKFVQRKETVKELRKKRMRVLSLFPLLCKTNSIIGEYLIKYPQYEMVKYLDSIMTNRFAKKMEDGIVIEYEWLWESNGYYSSSNYYYVTALIDFYNYYEIYEKRFFEVEKSNVKVVEQVKKEYFSQLIKGSGEIGILKKQLAELRVENAKLLSRESKFENATSEFIKEYISSNTMDILTKLFLQIKDSFMVDAIDGKKKTPEEKTMAAALKSAFFSVLSPLLYSVVKYDDSIMDKRLGLSRLENDFMADLRDSTGKYATQILNSADHQSEFVKTDCLKGISDLLKRNKKSD